jgi:cyclopropane fatty-acyl-phospholipid synthase-like methyltransferase
MQMNKPFSQACENNKRPILSVLENVFAESRSILEVGSGTGQHAVYFAQHLSHLTWQPTDVPLHLEGITAWLDDANLDNILAPVPLDVNQLPWELARVEGVFSANTLHIMGENEVVNFFKGVQDVLALNGSLCVYGPFNYQGKFTSESNARFQDWLKAQNPKSAIRDFEWINELAGKAGLVLINDHTMPANNRLLEWQKLTG